jgi:hypothetical protein
MKKQRLKDYRKLQKEKEPRQMPPLLQLKKKGKNKLKPRMKD